MAAYRCWAEVDLAALGGNLAWIRHRAGRGVKIITVVKADAYGHGLKQIAALLMQSGTDIFGVANLTEAQAVRSVGRGWPILMLGACLPHEVEATVCDDVMPTISSLAEARAFNQAAAKRRKTVRVHVKVDTGMGRLGVAVPDAVGLVEQIHTLPHLILEGIYTHYSAAEDDRQFSRGQTDRFTKVLEELQAKGLLPPLVHAHNSAALLHEAKTVYNVIRPGLLVYGILPPGRRRTHSMRCEQLTPALSFKCRASLVKEVPKGTPLSYGRTCVTSKPSRVATITAGYADGYPRAASNRADVLIRGRRCRVLGRVTMDQTLVDVSRVTDVRSGDEAVLIGRQGHDEITAVELAGWCGMIPWELLTNITYRVPRVYRGGHAS